MRAIKFLPALLLVFTGRAAAADSPVDGKWVVESVTKDGKLDDTWKGAVRENVGDKYTMAKDGGKSVSGTMKVDATRNTIDQMPNEGTYKGKTLLGVYSMESDTLTICFAEPGKDRPKEIAKGEGVTVVVYKKKN
jgi:uncharacterized protein (TIGR03067 family)